MPLPAEAKPAEETEQIHAVSNQPIDEDPSRISTVGSSVSAPPAKHLSWHIPECVWQAFADFQLLDEQALDRELEAPSQAARTNAFDVLNCLSRWFSDLSSGAKRQIQNTHATIYPDHENAVTIYVKTCNGVGASIHCYGDGKTTIIGPDSANKLQIAKFAELNADAYGEMGKCFRQILLNCGATP